jgi:hypothetical protein
MGVNGLRRRGMDLAAQAKPRFLAVNLVDPHDIMFIDTDRAGLNTLIDQEVGEDAGQMLPGGIDGGRVATSAVNDV